MRNTTFTPNFSINNQRCHYFDLTDAYFCEHFKEISKSTEFENIVKSVLDRTIPFDNTNDEWWNDFCTIPEKKQLIVELNEIKPTTIDQAYPILKNYSFPQLSPVEDPNKYKKYENVIVEETRTYKNPYYEHRTIVDEIFDDKQYQEYAISLAKSPEQIEWYCMLHNFVSNVQPQNIIEYCKNSTQLKLTTDITKPIIVCILWPNQNIPISDVIGDGKFKWYADNESIVQYLVEQLNYRPYGTLIKF